MHHPSPSLSTKSLRAESLFKERETTVQAEIVERTGPEIKEAKPFGRDLLRHVHHQDSRGT
jgi:hypothetical protein